ncbi:MAG: orotate phosphoribosyltransferase [Firmicutes bacterium]|nr:orotate phosphoribosyltransferase [Bacillota bacterium]
MPEQAMVDKIVRWLFETRAIQVSPAEEPFWYTSGLIGPYYINTHFLLGSEQAANELLALIDNTRTDPLRCTREVRAAVEEHYRHSSIFRQVIDALVEVLQASYDLSSIDYISGGERRDWFFSFMPALLLGKPHLTIFKDQRVILLDGDRVAVCPSLPGAKVLHISDLVTQASSYLRAWIPALERLQAKMVATLTIVDRRQGGGAALAQEQVPLQALVGIEASLFATAAAQGYLTPEQLQLVNAYLADPYKSMRQFLLNNPQFLQSALAGDARTAERARRLLAENLYDLPHNSAGGR